MAEKLEILLSSKSVQLIQPIENMLKKRPNCVVTTQINNHKKMEVLSGLPTRPDLIILALSNDWLEELRAFEKIPGNMRPPMLIIGSVDNRDAMRMAMRMGARDFLSDPVKEEELQEVINLVHREKSTPDRAQQSRITVVMNAKGGSGATMLACNISTILSQHLKIRTALVDLDMQFGSLPLYFDMMPKHSILEAMDIIKNLDPEGLGGFMMSHSSGVRILAAKSEKVVIPEEVSSDKLDLLLTMLQKDNEHIVIDVPRQIDHITTTALERGDNIIIVTQQTLPHIRDATRLLSILRNELAIPEDRIILVVNRYDRSSVVTSDDISKALKMNIALLIPNDFKNARESENIGIPLYEYARRSDITLSLTEFTERLVGKKGKEKRGLLHRVITNLTGSR